VVIIEPYDPELVLALAPESLLSSFNRAGVLSASDVHVALAMSRLAGEADEAVQLAAALAARAPRVGHVLADLSTIQTTVVPGEEGSAEEEPDLAHLPWPELSSWLASLRRSSLVSLEGEGPGLARPLRLAGASLYLDRYWRDELLVARELLRRAERRVPFLYGTGLGGALSRLFPTDPGGMQALAAATAVQCLLNVIVGGPGTGKTTTVARLLALLEEEALENRRPPPSVALAAPTGKAAARMAEAVHDEAGRLQVARAVRDELRALGASTVHRLLGRNPASASRFRHGAGNPLPYDVVVVDETSMMSLPLMARLLEALRPDAHLVLVGDHEQLASVEAGAVLADIVGPAGGDDRAGGDEDVQGPKVAGPLREPITVLTVNHRFSGPLADLASAVRSGEEERVLSVLRRGEADRAAPVRWLEFDPLGPEDPALEPVREAVAATGLALVRAGAAGDAQSAIAALGHLRVLCAHREGPYGASTWNTFAERWTAEAMSAGPGSEPWAGGESLFGEWYLGRPVIITENDYSLGLFNGDTGVAVRRADQALAVAFAGAEGIVTFSPSRLASAETAFALTAHKAQGSEFEEVIFVLPHPSSRILTRELFYTAVTRAKQSVTVVGTEAAVRSAIARRVARASGLTRRLWRAN
jgi:exodeoxyribonuclease V alpha subunit